MNIKTFDKYEYLSNLEINEIFIKKILENLFNESNQLDRNDKKIRNNISKLTDDTSSYKETEAALKDIKTKKRSKFLYNQLRLKKIKDHKNTFKIERELKLKDFIKKINKKKIIGASIIVAATALLYKLMNKRDELKINNKDTKEINNKILKQKEKIANLNKIDKPIVENIENKEFISFIVEDFNDLILLDEFEIFSYFNVKDLEIND